MVLHWFYLIGPYAFDVAPLFISRPVPPFSQAVEYDVLDTDASLFDEDFYAFRVVIKELERRLAAIIIQVRLRSRFQEACFSDI